MTHDTEVCCLRALTMSQSSTFTNTTHLHSYHTLMSHSKHRDNTTADESQYSDQLLQAPRRERERRQVGAPQIFLLYTASTALALQLHVIDHFIMCNLQFINKMR